jgi:hypothetical protein
MRQPVGDDQIHDARARITTHPICQVPRCGVGVDHEYPVAPHLGEQRPQRHRQGGLAGTALEAQYADLIGPLGAATDDPAPQFRLVFLIA